MPFKEFSPISQNEHKGQKSEREAEAESFADKFPDLVPFKEELEEYIKNNNADFAGFLEYRNAPYSLVCGDGFYHSPLDHKICLSVPYYKKCKEGGISMEQFMFAGFHEFAHLKTMMENDPAGRRNELSQMINYESRKTIRDAKDPGRFVNLQPTYRHYYNIMEDVMVNHLVLKTRHYSSVTNKHNHEEVKDFYTDKLFALYKMVGTGNGDFIRDEQDESGFRFVGEQQGDYTILDKNDYENGFDFNTIAPQLDRSGQFLTFFIKNQMLDLRTEDVAGVDNPQGKFQMQEDVASVFTKPLTSVYPELLAKILDKYKDDQRQKKRYLEFMSQVIATPSYEEKDGKVVKGSPILTENVFVRPRILSDGKEIDVYVEKKYDLNEQEMDDLLKKARWQFSRKMEEVCKQVGISNYRQATYLYVFNKFKETTKAKGYSLTDPLKLSLQERTVAMRKTLEPIFSMLCILDDNFDIELPSGEPQTKGGSEGGGPGQPERRPEGSVFQPGQKVRNIDPQSPNNGKIGIIASVNSDVDGKPQSVVVEYLEQENKMAVNTSFAAQSEEIFSPADNLAIITKKGSKSSGQAQKEKVKYEFEEEDDDEDENDKEEENGENTEEDEDDGDDGGSDKEEAGDGESEKNEGEKDDENKGADDNNDNKDAGAENNDSASKSNQPQNGKEKRREKLIKETEATIDALKKMIEEDERNENIKDLEKAKEGKGYQEKKIDSKKKDKLRKMLNERERQEDGELASSKNISSEEVISAYQRLEKEIRPFADEMAKAWLEVVKNISHEIRAAKEKYFISGKMDMKKVQRIFPMIEAGKKIDEVLVYERWVEKIFTEIRPRMMRLVLLVDNSGSMSAHADSIRTMALLLNKSLDSLKNLFKLEMEKILGSSSGPAATDFVTDTEIYLFGNKNNHQLIKKFDLSGDDLDFLNDPKKKSPQRSIDDSQVDILRVFQKLTCNESTYDGSLWKDIYQSHNQDSLNKKIKSGQLTEFIFQISDGAIDEEATATEIINLIHEDFNIPTGGLAIGGDDAVESLKKRHGENVRRANNASEIAREFGKFLQELVKDQIEKPMLDYIKKGF